MGLYGRPRLYHLDHPATPAERKQAERNRRAQEWEELCILRQRKHKAYHQSGFQEWETPEPTFTPWHARFGFSLDVCALPHNTKCPRFFSPHDDGLQQDWGTEICWMNPPFGRGIAQWLEKAYISAQQGATVVCLIKSSTDAKWWQHYSRLADEVHFLDKRVRFVGATDRAPFPCCIFVFLPQPPLQEIGNGEASNSDLWRAGTCVS